MSAINAMHTEGRTGVKNVAFLISGRGSTMMKSLGACQGGPLEGLINPGLVVVSKEGTEGEKRALDFGLSREQVVVCTRKGRPEEEWGQALLALLEAHEIDLLFQVGWMPKTPRIVVEAFEGRSCNQHPAPLDTGFLDFGGQNMHGRRAQAARLFFARATHDPEELWTESTVHRITVEFDKGAVIGRSRVSIEQGDDTDTLAERVLPVEHALVIETLRKFATGEIVEQPRETRLVKPDQLKLLERCKEFAGYAYPKG
jgi:folate-dependent phosphoribosylglycinamide formyltransferase PurN